MPAPPLGSGSVSHLHRPPTDLASLISSPQRFFLPAPPLCLVSVSHMLRKIISCRGQKLKTSDFSLGKCFTTLQVDSRLHESPGTYATATIFTGLVIVPSWSRSTSFVPNPSSLSIKLQIDKAGDKVLLSGNYLVNLTTTPRR